MTRATRSALAALIALTVLGMLLPGDGESFTETSFGVVPGGHRAAFELLEELGVPVTRSYAPPEQLEDDAVVWWIDPRDLCGGLDDEEAAWDLVPWLRRGGTALVFLPVGSLFFPSRASARGGDGTAFCGALGEIPVPQRTPDWTGGPRDDDGLAAEGPEESAASPEDIAAPDPESADGVLDRWWRGELGVPGHVAGAPQQLAGLLPPRPRTLVAPPLRRFLDAGEFEVGATLEGLPFLLERRVGAGRLVLVADGSFLVNALLDRGDAAPFAVDLVRAYGVPRFDERAHGLRAQQHPVAYLAASPALPVFLGLVAIGGLALWRGGALPRHRVDADAVAAPSLDRFVDSLASLYARSRDHARVAERYRELSLARIRRSLGLPSDTSQERVLERLGRHGRVSAGLLQALLDPPEIQGAAALRSYARRLDQLVKEVSR